MSTYQRGSVILVKQKNTSVWRFRFRENGVQRSEYLGTAKALPRKADAEKAANRFRKRLNTTFECITVADLIAKFWRESAPERETTAHSYRSIFARIEAKWGSLRIDALAGKTAEVKEWLTTLETADGKREVSPLYRAQVRNLLHLLCEKAMLWNHLIVDRNPIELIRLKGSSERQKELVVLTVDQYQKLLDDRELPLLVKTMIQLAASLGLRVSETLGLRWKDFDFEAGTVSINRSVAEGKKHKTKTTISKAVLPLHPEIAAMLQKWRESEPVVKGWVFGSKRTGMPYNRDYLRSEYVQPAGERIGVDGLGWHSLRHTYRALMRQEGVSLEDQKNLMRHSRLATTIDTYGGDEKVEQLRPVNAKVVEMLKRRSA